MPSRTDDFSKPTADTIGKRAAFICSNPECRRATLSPSDIDPEKFIYVGVAAHIRAASLGGPRYAATMTAAERSAASNGIFLCCNCSVMIDKNDGSGFPFELLHN